jgi:hypothetical protein
LPGLKTNNARRCTILVFVYKLTFHTLKNSAKD